MSGRWTARASGRSGVSEAAAAFAEIASAATQGRWTARGWVSWSLATQPPASDSIGARTCPSSSRCSEQCCGSGCSATLPWCVHALWRACLLQPRVGSRCPRRIKACTMFPLCCICIEKTAASRAIAAGHRAPSPIYHAALLVQIVDMPLLFEIKADRWMIGGSIVVLCSPERQLQRLQQRDGAAGHTARQRPKLRCAQRCASGSWGKALTSVAAHARRRPALYEASRRRGSTGGCWACPMAGVDALPPSPHSRRVCRHRSGRSATENGQSDAAGTEGGAREVRHRQRPDSRACAVSGAGAQDSLYALVATRLSTPYEFDVGARLHRPFTNAADCAGRHWRARLVQVQNVAERIGRSCRGQRLLCPLAFAVYGVVALFASRRI